MDFDETLLEATREESRRRGGEDGPGLMAEEGGLIEAAEAFGYALGMDGAFLERCAHQIAELHAEVEALKARVTALGG